MLSPLLNFHWAGEKHVFLLPLAYLTYLYPCLGPVEQTLQRSESQIPPSHERGVEEDQYMADNFFQKLLVCFVPVLQHINIGVMIVHAKGVSEHTVDQLPRLVVTCLLAEHWKKLVHKTQ